MNPLQMGAGAFGVQMGADSAFNEMVAFKRLLLRCGVFALSNNRSCIIRERGQ